MVVVGYTGFEVAVGVAGLRGDGEWLEDELVGGSVDDGFRGVLKGDLKGWESLEEAALRRRRLDAGDGDMSASVRVDFEE